MFLAIVGALATAASPVANAPTYLRCSFPARKVDVLITADEANSTVTVSVPTTGFTEKLPAAFTATEVRFQNRQLTYVVSRTDLSIVRTIKAIDAIDNGNCAVEQAPKRAF